MPTFHHGRHEFGQNFLTDRATLTKIKNLVARTNGPIIEIGPGDGAITQHLARLGRALTVIEIDPDRADRLRNRLQPTTEVVNTDFLTYHLPPAPHVLVGNVPFHLTTAILRRILHAPGWTDAILLVQWEVARRRAGVGGATMMTTQWNPWFSFTLEGRVPSHAFTPRPSVDGGLLHIHRRPLPLLPLAQRRNFQDMVHRVYTSRGRGLAQILANTTFTTTQQSRAWLREVGLRPSDLPGRIPDDTWIDLYKTTGTSPPPGGERKTRRTRGRTEQSHQPRGRSRGRT